MAFNSRNVRVGARYGLNSRQVVAFFDAYGNRCLCCGASGDDMPLVIDHVHSRMFGGENHPDNFQPLCVSCNSSKRSRAKDYRSYVVPADSILCIDRGGREKRTEPVQRITVDLPTGVYAKLRRASFESHRTMNAIAAECLDRCVAPDGTVTLPGESPAPPSPAPPAE